MRDESQVIIVMLRQPNRSRRGEMRSDPFYEFGSFGCTRCHARTLLRLANMERVRGHRLAFAQGGPDEIRLVYLTPPITKFIPAGDGCIATWRPAEMPFVFTRAPVLASNQDACDFPRLAHEYCHARRSTPVARFSSRFRSCITPLIATVSREIVAVYERNRRKAGADGLAGTYEQALPYSPPKIDRRRAATYRKLLGDRGIAARRPCC